jgi:hypothetical protein
MCEPFSHLGARTALACAAALLLGSPAALAEDAADLLNDPFHLELGTFIMNSDIDARLDGEFEQGTEVNWDRTFGDEDATRFRFDGYWRFADRHKLRFLWFNYARSDKRTTSRDIEWGDEVIPVDTEVKAESSFDVYELAYEYAFMRRDTFELAANIGLHYADISLTLAAKASTSGGSLDEDVKEEATLAAPLPVIGLRGTWALPYNFSIDASAQYFAVSIDEYDGSLQDYRIGVTWQPRKWLGVGLGYDRFSVDVDVEKDSFTGSLDWTYSGPMIYYSATF